jgi:AcrR family transcriptional regulator
MPQAGVAMSVRDSILKIATRRFASVGYEATTMRSIATRAGITLPTIYHYFGDKSDLYLEVCMTTFGPRAERAIQAFQKSHDSEQHRILTFFTDLATDLMDDENFFKLLHREMIDQTKDGVRKLTEKCWKHSFNTLCEAFRHIASDTRDPAELTLSCFALMLGLVEFRRGAPFLHEDFRKLYTAKQLTELVLKTVVPEIEWSRLLSQAA